MEIYHQAIHQARFLQKHNWIQAVKVLEEAILHHADEIDLHLELANFYYQKGSAYFTEDDNNTTEQDIYMKKALESFHKALKIEPQNILIYFRIGNIYLEMSEPRLALYYYEMIPDPTPDVLYNMAIAYEQGCNVDKAVKTLKTLISNTKQMDNAYYFLIELLISDGYTSEAKKYLTIAENLYIESPHLHYLKGMIYARSLNYFMAYNELLKSFPEYSNKAKVFHLIGLSADGVGLTNEAISYLWQGLLLRRNSRPIYYDLLNILLKNHHIKTKKEVQLLIKIPDDDILDTVKRLLEKCGLSEEVGVRSEEL